MTVIERGILVLIKSAVLQQGFPLPEGFSLEEAYPLIKRHHIVPMAFEGALQCGIPRSGPVMQQMFLAYCKALQISQGQLEEVARLFGLFEENGIDYLPLKGCVMKGYYPKPEIRTMGDADILIRTEQYEKIVSLMKSSGFRWESDSEYHAAWCSDRLEVELHWGLMTGQRKSLYGYFKEPWTLAATNTGHRYAMTVEDTFLFLFSHFTKHFMASGIGCRQVVDLWLYRQRHPEMDEGLLCGKLETLHLREFYENILGLLDYWFGEGEGNEKLEYISSFILGQGSWGFEKNNALSDAALQMSKSRTMGGAKFRFYLKRLFPRARQIQDRYSVLRKAPWLLPVIWVVRVFDKLFVRRDFSRKVTMFRSVLSDDSVQEKYQAFAAIGLDQCL